MKKYKIAIVGPESSGKSTLVKGLAQLFNESYYVEEFARDYLERRTSYDIKELDYISKCQLELESKKLVKVDRFLFCDTNPLSIKVWSLYKYGSYSNSIKEMIEQSFYDLHLLLKPDLPYESDPLRENPNSKDRQELFELFQQEIENLKLRYEIIDGTGNYRLKKAGSVLKEHFSF